VTREASTGRNLTAVANAKATRSVIYTNSDSSKKVTITLDPYATASDASSAYQEAVAKSKTVPAFKPVPAQNLGQNAFVGTVTQAGETHIGLGALRGTLIVGATLAGYDPTPENTANLIALTRARTRCQSRYGSNPTEIVALASIYFLYRSLFSAFPFARNEVTRLSCDPCSA
jgi:hypothetical protein